MLTDCVIGIVYRVIVDVLRGIIYMRKGMCTFRNIILMRMAAVSHQSCQQRLQRQGIDLLLEELRLLVVGSIHAILPIL